MRAFEDLAVHTDPETARKDDVVVGDGVFLGHQGLVNGQLLRQKIGRLGVLSCHGLPRGYKDPRRWL